MNINVHVHVCAAYDNYALFYIYRICSEVIAGIVIKCLNARPKTKELGINICLMYIEIEKQDIVIVSDLSLPLTLSP